MKAIADKYLSKFISRKLLAYTIATIAVMCGMDLSDNYTYITMVFIGGQALVDYKGVK